MLFLNKNVFSLLLFTFLLSVFFSYGQTTTTSYEKLWDLIQTDTISNEQKLHYLDQYIQKAQQENNLMEQYQALQKKSYLVPFQEAVIILHKIHPVVHQLNNDSITGNFYNRSTVFYYKHRYFKQALDYAIASEVFNEKNKNLYNLYSVRIDIGNIYYHIRDYKKAESYFIKAKDFYKKNTDYNYRRSYIVALYSLGKTYLQQADISALEMVIKESEKAIPELNFKDQQLENAYLNYLRGGSALLQNQFLTAQQFLKEALPNIKQNGDFTNEHVVYLYLGKVLWLQNKKQEAIKYFEKINQLFQEKRFLNYELREALDYLAAYYKETGQVSLQLQAIEHINLLNQQFEKEQKDITDRLYHELETKKIETELTQLQNKLQTNKFRYTLLLIIAGILLLVLTVYSYRKNRKQKQLKEKFINLLATVEKEKKLSKNNVLELEAFQQTITKTLKRPEKSFKVATMQTKTTSEKNNISSQQINEQRIFKALEQFEQEKRFLNLVKTADGSMRALKIEDLATQLNTNRTTLSHFLNTHKGGFAAYLAQLRIKQITLDLTENKNLRKMNMQELPEIYGFASIRSFNMQFKEQTGLTPSYFVKELELRDMEQQKNV